MRRLRALLPYLRRHPWKLALGITSVLLSVGVGLFTPLIVGSAIDALRESVSSGRLLTYAGVLVLVTLIQGIFSFSQRSILVSLSRDIEFELRDTYFQHLERLPLSFYQHHYTGDLMARGTNDLQAVRMLCGPAIMYASNTLFTAVGASILMWRIHWQLTLLALATLPLVAVATKVFGERIHHLFERVQEQFSTLSARVQENLAGVRVVRAYAQEQAEQESFAGVNREYVERNRSLIRWTASFHPLLQALVGVGFVLVLWRGVTLVMLQRITLGELVSFNFFLSKLIWPMIAIGWVINLVQRGSASLGRILQILESVAEIDDRHPTVQGMVLTGNVSFRELTFSYQGKAEPALSNVTFEVAAGQTIAVVGRTGSGKSTLLSLLPRLIDPPDGRLFLDGIDVKDLPLATLRSAIAVVPQETFLFSTTLAENIRLGRPQASDAEVVEAARNAGLESDLVEFPDGVDTLVGERGLTLSGGQKQRVALARALLKDSSILVLDDCFSAVDTQTEELILAGLAASAHARTIFLVSHRVSTVRHADLILVLRAGRIEERGTHLELIGRAGFYADLERRQQLEAELAVR